VKPKSALEDAESSVAMLVASLDASEARVNLARTNLERVKVRAPISGVVASRHIESGQFVQVGAPLFDVIDLSKVTMEAMVPLNRLVALQPGQTADLWLPQDPEHFFSARVARISPRAEQGSRSAVVYLDVENAEGILRGAMFMTGRIRIREKLDAIALPKDAVTFDGSSASVHLIRDKRIVDSPVTTGAQWQAGNAIEIMDGLVSGDAVLTRPLRGLEPGDLVRIGGN
ncbi:MAG TPA: efflux RND transporter periplasmic adaptor subunit, partial [Thermomicrobiales bacterium]|nr:efflux RND transporter periplasmic adaptor subunit [Thermomicrobiales bacterium]